MTSIRKKSKGRKGTNSAREGWRLQFQVEWSRKGSQAVTFHQRLEVKEDEYSRQKYRDPEVVVCVLCWITAPGLEIAGVGRVGHRESAHGGLGDDLRTLAFPLRKKFGAME